MLLQGLARVGSSQRPTWRQQVRRQGRAAINGAPGDADTCLMFITPPALCLVHLSLLRWGYWLASLSQSRDLRLSSISLA